MKAISNMSRDNNRMADELLMSHFEASTTQSALELVESGETIAKMDNLLYILQGFESLRESVHCNSVKQLINECKDEDNRLKSVFNFFSYFYIVNL